eukprot:TRINITY_DN13482_c0_g1_i1.p1 TRINITY_DN13482_c0_g1~~TRINITY_DN13482_c0_g1_i1.p1  ORF type:complete len:106 (-),score=15.77 TRINITY_DN13482_c0_g1_i1:64-381(-)
MADCYFLQPFLFQQSESSCCYYHNGQLLFDSVGMTIFYRKVQTCCMAAEQCHQAITASQNFEEMLPTSHVISLSMTMEDDRNHTHNQAMTKMTTAMTRSLVKASS